ncbi:MAG: Hsp20/alpha crystallin family protein [Deltaproteobacteria bacterium]|nr:Hsp20/alpha crystallin family protein [Deltaproteobacteria bacterium]
MFELKKWEPFRELSAIQREMDDLFKRTFGSLSANIFRREFKGAWYPDVDSYIKEGRFIVHADLPGVDPKNVEVTIVGNVLTLRGERKSEIEEKKGEYLVHEATFGAFERTMTLPEGVDTAKVNAVYKNGVLEVSMPTKAGVLPKKVKVEIEEAKEGTKAA